MTTIEKLEEEIRLIKEKNRRVETDKFWETSWTRKIIVGLFTYLSIGLYLNAINIPQAWLNAIVPTIGFLLSTLTLPFIKDLWRRYIHKN